MLSIYFFSGPCGCGKTTLSNAFAHHLVNELDEKQVYIIHGDDVRGGFIDSDSSDKYAEGKLTWEEILKFNWECILHTAERALSRGLSVVIDYVVEDELPLIKTIAKNYGASFYYVVLTASDESIKQRIAKRGDCYIVDRALFLKNKLDNMKENTGHLFDNTDMTVEEELKQLKIEDFLVE